MSGLGAARGPASQEVSQVDIEIHEDGRPVIVWGNVKDKDTENLVKLCVRAREEGRKLRIFHVHRSWMDIDQMINEATAKAEGRTPAEGS
jgi:hypothetical protein